VKAIYEDQQWEEWSSGRRMGRQQRGVWKWGGEEMTGCLQKGEEGGWRGLGGKEREVREREERREIDG